MKRKRSDDNLTLENARKLYQEMERNIILSEYQFPTKPSSDGFYHIYVEDKTKKSGRRQLKAKNLENLKEKVYLHEKGISGSSRKTFKDAFEISQNERLKYVKDPEKKLSVQNSITCMQYDYERYFSGTDFERKYVDTITKKDIEDVCMMNLQRHDLAKKAFLSLRGIIKQTLNLAFENYWINENPYFRVDFKRYEQMLIRTLPSEKRVHSDKDLSRMLEYIHNHQKKKPEFIPAYALELQLLAGLRRAEVPPLEWEDITDEYISITKEQILVRKGPNVDKGYCKIVNHTKTYVDRQFPITSEIQEFILKLRNAHSRFYPDSKYLFPSKTTTNGVISNTAVYRFYARMCNNLNIPISAKAKKGPHSFRRNGITKIANSSDGNLLIASILYGNSVLTASKHYYSGVSLEQAKSILEKG